MAIPVIVDLLGAAPVLALVLLARRCAAGAGCTAGAGGQRCHRSGDSLRLEDQNRLLAGLEPGARAAGALLRSPASASVCRPYSSHSARSSGERSAAEQRLAAQSTWIEEQTRFFEEKIASTANRLLEEKSAAFTEVNRKSIDAWWHRSRSS